MRYVSLVLTIALVAGLGAGVTIDAPLVFAITLTMSAAWAMWLLAHARGKSGVQLAASCVFVMAAGWLLGAQAIDDAMNAPLRVLLEQRLLGGVLDRRIDEPITIEGELAADAMPSADGVVLRLQVRRVWITNAAEPTSGGVSLGIGGERSAAALSEWTAGRILRAPALLRRPARYMNHGLADQERVLARRGISLVGSIKSAALVEVVERGRWWQEAAASVRARTRAALARHVGRRHAQSSAIGTAILIGDRGELSNDTERRLQEAGTYHVIAISGGNIAILVGLLLGGMALAGLRGRTAAALVIGALCAYGVIASGGASVARATLMAVIYLAIRLIDQRTAPINAISVTATVLLIASPLSILDVGFWFTFGATTALVAAARLLPVNWDPMPVGAVPRTPRPRSPLSRLCIAIVAVLAGTACVELALAPIAAYVFQRVTLAGLILNFIALPAMTVVQLSATAVVAADVLGFGAAADAAGIATHYASVALTESCRLLDYTPWLTWRVPSPHPLLLAMYYACMAAALSLWLLWRRLSDEPRTQRRQTGHRVNTPSMPAVFARATLPQLATLAALALFIWIVVAPDARVRSHGDGRLHVSMIDVGQGDAVLVTFPNGRNLLVDTGGMPRGDFDIGDRVIGPALRARGILSLDYLAVTHGDADHLGGAVSLVRDFSPREVWWGIPVTGHEPTARVVSEAMAQRAAWRLLQRDDRLDIGNVHLRVRHPPPADWERQRVRNNDSVVIELRFGRVSVLLTGDIEREAEEQLTALDLLPIVVLKVPHHGSLTSSTHSFLRTVQPDVALIGVGRGNTYGHPAPHVLGRLADAGAEIFRTDLDGQITVVTNGISVWTRSFNGRTHTTKN